jgi:hypothetical protein
MKEEVEKPFEKQRNKIRKRRRQPSNFAYNFIAARIRRVSLPPSV